MKNQCSDFQKAQHPYFDQGKSMLEDDYLQRSNFEIKRRFHGLQIRREHLERELQAVKHCLISLDRQIQNDSLY